MVPGVLLCYAALLSDITAISQQSVNVSYRNRNGAFWQTELALQWWLAKQADFPPSPFLVTVLRRALN